MSGFFNRLGFAQNASNQAQDTQNKLQSQQIANAINALSLKKAQLDSQGSNLAGNFAASGNMPDQSLPTQPTPMPPPGGAPPGPPPGSPQQLQNVPMPGAMPMQGGMPPQGGGMGIPPMGPQGMPPGGQMPQIPQVNASALQPPGGGQMQGPQAQSTAPQAAPQQQQAPWWRTTAAQIKKQNPDASGEQIMAAIEKLTPMMNNQNKQDFENFKVHVEQQQKEANLSERERNDQTRAQLTARGQDMNAANVGARVGATERGQDIGASNVQARVGAQERGQDITSSDRGANRDERAREADQRNATTLQVAGQRLKSVGASKTGDPAYKALADEYKTTAAAQRTMMNNPGLYTDEQKAALDQKVQSLQARIDSYTKTAPATSTSAASTASNVPSDLPSPQGLAEGTVAKDSNGNAAAIIKNGAWAAP